MKAVPEYQFQRQLLAEQLAGKGIGDRRVLEAIATVPRHLFVKRHLWGQAYGDWALALEHGQTISQPWVVARMTELLEVGPGDRVLEIGTGSGYQTAVLALLAKWVFSLERIGELARGALRRLRELEVTNVKIQTFDGTIGWSEFAPYSRILVTAGAPKVPEPLLDQLAPGGRLLVPEGDRDSQELAMYTKSEDGRIARVGLDPVTFVPLVGRYGWDQEVGA